MYVLRPCDAIETFESWEFAIQNHNAPTALILSRQNLPLQRKDYNVNKIYKGAYFLKENDKAKFTIIATDRGIAWEKVYDHFENQKIKSNLVSMPTWKYLINRLFKYKQILDKKPKIILRLPHLLLA